MIKTKGGEKMNFGSFVVIVILAVVVILDIRYLRRKGFSDCAGDCNQCHGTCKWSDDLKQARREIAAEKE